MRLRGQFQRCPILFCFLGLLFLLGGALSAFGFALSGYTWPARSQIVMHLQLSRASGPLQDGSADWNASAADALSIWNQHIDIVKFVADVATGSSGADGANEVLFSKTVYDGSWPTGVLAVTLNISSQNSFFTETDVLFNDNLNWDSYRGPHQGSGPTGTYDLHRVALHEFGHVLGLDHPDEWYQHVTAIMNSVISDLDHLTDDDIAGAQALYGIKNLTVYLGADFRYLITPMNAVSYVATGLPAGLTIDPVSGLISGIATISGTYSADVTVNQSTGTSRVFLQITVTDPPSDGSLQKLDLAVNRLAADPSRSRVYATLRSSNSVVVIDSVSLNVIKTIPVGSNPLGLAVSADGSKLWVANSGSTTGAISVIDLNSLTTLTAINAPSPPSDIEEGLDHRLYVTPATQNGGVDGIMQIDASTGAFQGRLGGFEVYMGGFLEISPDRKTLYFGNRGLSGATAERFDVSTAAATLLQQVGFNGGDGEDLKLSHAGKFLVYPNAQGNGPPSNSTYEIPANDLRGVNGMFNTGTFPGPVTFSGDDLVLYEGAQNQNKVDIFDSATFALTGAISWKPSPSGDSYDTQDLVVENTGARLFVATRSSSGSGDLRVFNTGRKNVGPSGIPEPRGLVNVSTRLRVQSGEGALIGGFIITGSDTKTVVVRAIGPSLPLAGTLVDPMLEIYDSAGALIASDDNWNSDRAHILNAGLAPGDEHEAALVVSLPAGAYTAIVRDVSGASGIGLVELYDLDSSNSRLANISTRGVVESGDNVMIGGFILRGDQPTKVIVRGIGPSLTANGVMNALPDPVLELHDGNGALITQNDDWRSLQEEAITQTGIAPRDDRESAIVATLPAGNYTAILRGKDDGVGVGLVEVYNLDLP